MSIKVMSSVWEHSQSKEGMLLVLLAIADFSDDNGAAYPAVSTIAKKARLSVRQTQNCIKALSEAGELKVKINGGPHGCNLYRVQLLRGAITAGVQFATGGGEVECTGGVKWSAPEPSVNRQEPSMSTQANACVASALPNPQKERVSKGSMPNCPADKIVALYHELLPTCRQVAVITETRRSHLQQRWREMYSAGEFKTQDEGLAAFADYFKFVARSHFLTGRAKQIGDRKPFVADLEWLVKPGNFAKVIEGKYQ